ncbi:MAG: amidohydrolase family protein [Nitrospinota bacterium]
METVDLLVRDGIVVTLDDPDPSGQDRPGPERIFRGSVAVRADRIVAVGPTAELDAAYEAAKTLDASERIVLPGLIDLHNHLRNLTAGLPVGQGLKLDDFLRSWWEMQEHLTEGDYYAGAMLGALRLLRAGVTTVVDHCYPFHLPGLEEATLRAFDDLGIRGYLARGIMTKPYAPICETREAALGRIRRLVEEGGVARERLFVAPVSFRQADPDDYRAARRLADDLGLRTYTHIAETRQEVEGIVKAHGRRPIHFLHELGFSGPDTVLVHCVLLDDSEIERLAETRTTVVHCPSNHMKLAKGVTRVPDLLRAGVNMTLGVDVMENLWIEMRNELQLQSLANSDPRAVPEKAPLYMATRNGAKALGMEGELGVLAPGAKADLILVDIGGASARPFLNAVHHLLWRTEAADVRTVLVDGKIVLEEGRIRTLDEAETLDGIEKSARAYIRRAAKEDLLPDYAR